SDQKRKYKYSVFGLPFLPQKSVYSSSSGGIQIFLLPVLWGNKRRPRRSAQTREAVN
uniref:Uncharacterized protein n=1 Tax=Pseudonaja textilis TaxID=8673 RepID=A0A670YI46_PSETE